jgi:hypothetical protein
VTIVVTSSLDMSSTPTNRNILNPEHEDFHAAKRLDRFNIANVGYVRADSLASLKEPRTRKSSNWLSGEKLLP